MQVPGMQRGVRTVRFRAQKDQTGTQTAEGMFTMRRPMVPGRSGAARKPRRQAAAIAAIAALVGILSALALLAVGLPAAVALDQPVPPWLQHAAGLVLVAAVAVCVALVRDIL